MRRNWSADDILVIARSYQQACLLVAAAELNIFEVLEQGPRSGQAVADALRADPRATVVLLDALVSLDLLEKLNESYSLAPNVGELLTDRGADSVLAMVRHQGVCLRRWSQLAKVVRTGVPAERQPSIRGEEADQAAFIGAMHDISSRHASQVIGGIEPLDFTHALDVGGASGTWLIELLRRHPDANGTLFDLPHVMPMAQRRIADAGLTDRVTFVAGDFLVDPLPPGADLAWVSAIVHQNTREQNRRLFSAVFAALTTGGQIFVRDIVMQPSRTAPATGALFAVNMLVATEGGGTFTFDEVREDLESAGFIDAAVLRQDDGMNSIVVARKPRAAA